MYTSIIVHRTKAKDAIETSKYLLDKLTALYPGRIRDEGDGRDIFVDRHFHISVRCYTDEMELGGITPAYYYTDAADDSYVGRMLMMGAARFNGKRINTIDQLIEFINWYVDVNDRIDKYLGCNKQEG